MRAKVAVLTKMKAHAFKDHELQINCNFQKYCKSIFQSEEKFIPKFNKQSFFTYFKSIFLEKRTSKKLNVPTWLKTTSNTAIDSEIGTPAYKEVPSPIRRMRSCGPPLDHTSINSYLIIARTYPGLLLGKENLS